MTSLAVMVALVIAVVAMEAMAQGTEKGGPFDPALFGAYAWVVGISMLGGFASFYRRVRAGDTKWVNLAELAGELATSALAGLLTYWLCRSSGMNDWMMAAFVGISGHMGSRALFVLEKVLENWAQRMTGTGQVQPPMARGTPGDER
jgi:hypothetical protein